MESTNVRYWPIAATRVSSKAVIRQTTDGVYPDLPTDPQT
jgi:hypothetical protein